MVKSPQIKIRGWLTIPGIAAAFVGTVVGAGFGSGQEIYRFFTVQGLSGCLGVIFSVIILGAAGTKVFRIGLALRPKSYKDFFTFCLGPSLAKISDLMITLFFIILVGVMFAGCGAVFEELGFGYWPGIILSAILVVFILFKELPGLISANLVIVPLMFLGALIVSVFAIQNRCAAPVSKSPDFNWILAAMQFSAYNLVLAIPVLLGLCRKYPFLTSLELSGWVGSLTLGVMAGLINWSIILHLPHLQRSPLPMVDLARLAGNWVYWIYALALWGEMLTTLLADTYGVARRLVTATGLPFRIWVIILTLAGILIGEIGFSNLVAKFYPFFGYFCLLVLIMVMVKKAPNIKNKDSGH